jgi:hypothetical protein
MPLSKRALEILDTLPREGEHAFWWCCTSRQAALDGNC